MASASDSLYKKRLLSLHDVLTR